MAVIRTSKVDLKVNGAGAYAFVAQPDDDATHPGLVLIQEWWGIESHIIDLAQKLAADGFVVAVPDLYHGQVVTEPNEAQKAVMMLQQNLHNAVNEIVGALETLKTNPSVNPKKLGLMGFCVGGFLAWTVASRYSELGAVVTFYGAGYDPTPEDVAKINAPVLAVSNWASHSSPKKSCAMSWIQTKSSRSIPSRDRLSSMDFSVPCSE